MKISWSEHARRYRAESGRFIKRTAITDALERARDEVKKRVVTDSESLRGGSINLPEWQIRMRDNLKAMHLLSAGIARGGKRNLSPAELGRIGALTRQQYAYLNQFARDIANGRQRLDGRFLQRASMYVDASRMTFSETEKRLQRNAGVKMARRVLHARESCSGCVSEADRGFVEIDSLAQIGSKECRTNCRCGIVYKEAA